jgi:hypothetical protein
MTNDGRLTTSTKKGTLTNQSTQALLCASNAFTCAPNVVLTNGHPLPGPFKFCSVTLAALIRPFLSATLSPSGKLTFTLGLFTAWPARTSLVSAAMNASREGGHEQGTEMGWPAALFTGPLQSPNPVGGSGALTPRSGARRAMSAAVTLPLVAGVAGTAGVAAGEAACLVEAGDAGLVAGAAGGAAGALPPSIVVFPLAARASRSFLCLPRVVDANGQPLPGPLRFCSETAAALIRADASAMLFPTGKETPTEGLLTA